MSEPSQIAAAVANAITKATGAVENYGPQAVELAGRYLQIAAIGEKVGFFILILLAIAGAYIVKSIIQWHDEDPYDREGACVPVFIIGLLSFLAGLVGVIGFLDPASWAAVANPDLALMAKVVQQLN